MGLGDFIESTFLCHLEVEVTGLEQPGEPAEHRTDVGVESVDELDPYVLEDPRPSVLKRPSITSRSNGSKNAP